MLILILIVQKCTVMQNVYLEAIILDIVSTNMNKTFLILSKHGNM